MGKGRERSILGGVGGGTERVRRGICFFIWNPFPSFFAFLGPLLLVYNDKVHMETATHSRTLDWRTPWTEEPDGQSMGSQRVRHNWTHMHTYIYTHIYIIWRKSKVKVKSLSCVLLFVTPWTGAYQASPSMGFSRQEYWSGLPFPSPGDLPNPGIKPGSPALKSDALTSEPPGKPEMATPSVFLAGESQGWRSLVGCCLWDRTESDKTEAI